MNPLNWIRSLFRQVQTPSVKREYQAAKSSHLTAGFGQSTSSADSEIRTSLTKLRARSRQLIRDSAYAKRARTIVVNNVIGSGIGLQAQVHSSRNQLHATVNDGIEEAWAEWAKADSCHVGGSLCFQDIERFAMGEVFEAGELFARMHFRQFGGSRVPFALELIESERIPHEFQSGFVQGDNRLGIEVDKYYRPIAYWVRERHPSDIQPGGIQSDNVTRVPASEMIHLRLIDRWPQTRGVPWLHAVARKLNDMDGYSEAEITAARASAMYLGWEETPDAGDPTIVQQSDGSFETEMEPNTILRPPPGSKLNFYAPNRPNAALDPFMRYMLREVAAGVGVSYEALSRDYSQSNYSSSRLSLLDDRDLWRMLQQWFIRSFRAPIHRMWLQQAVFAKAIKGLPVSVYGSNPDKFSSVRFRPRGWSWVDPTKEVAAFRSAVRAGFMTLQDVVESSGIDFEELLRERKDELSLIEKAGLVLDTDPRQVSNAGLTQARPLGATLPLEQEDAIGLSSEQPSDQEVMDDDDDSEDDAEKRMRVVK